MSVIEALIILFTGIINILSGILGIALDHNNRHIPDAVSIIIGTVAILIACKAILFG